MSEPGFSHVPRLPDRRTVPALGGPDGAPSDSVSAARVLALQRLAGNRAVSALLGGLRGDLAVVQRQMPENPQGSPGNPIDLDAWAAENPQGSPGNPIDLDAWAAENPQGSPGNPIELDRPSATEGAEGGSQAASATKGAGGASQAASASAQQGSPGTAQQSSSASAQQSSPGTVARTPTPKTLKEVWKSIQRTGSQYPRTLQLVFLGWARFESGDEAARNPKTGKGGSSALNFNMMNAEFNMGEKAPALTSAPTSGVTDPEHARQRFDPKLNGPLSDWHPEATVPMSYYYYDKVTKEKWDARTIDLQLATLPQRKSQWIAVLWNNFRRPAFPDLDSGVSYALRWFDRAAKKALGGSAARKALAEKALAGDVDSALMIIEGDGNDPHWNGTGEAYRSLLKANYAAVAKMADSGAFDDKP